MACEVPVIDMQDFPSQAEKLVGACEDWGCFRLINHTIPATLMSEMKSVVRSLLDLPLEIKQRNRDAITGSGYVAPTAINPLYEALGLYDIGSVEAVRAFCAQLDASPLQRCPFLSSATRTAHTRLVKIMCTYMLHTHRSKSENDLAITSRHPMGMASFVCGYGLPGLKETIVRYSQAVHELAMDICRKLAASMGLKSDLFDEWPCQLRINKYNFTPEMVGTPGVQIHTDGGFLTILQEDENVGGLEVMDKKSSEFIPIDPLPGTLLVNLGDIATSPDLTPRLLWSSDLTRDSCLILSRRTSHRDLYGRRTSPQDSYSVLSRRTSFWDFCLIFSRGTSPRDFMVVGLRLGTPNLYLVAGPRPKTVMAWSNGRFYNLQHRVQCKEAKIRVSIALFVLGPKEAAVEAPAELVDSEHPRLYVPINFEDYRKLRLSTGLRAGRAQRYEVIQS
ncbi:hypothetical protein RJ640_000173 [Escallonia rubra]|uniref:Fe2OG dioxygenase domain-containing protein n=1 Tax=Escallonia rubra TaxID=112253 RepID=A0AA88R2J9_9ASTE|nr:hypothetical protein RJ640_000173 [Escallonia rubra]